MRDVSKRFGGDVAGVKSRNGKQAAAGDGAAFTEADRLAASLDGELSAVLRALSGSAVEELQLERDGLRISLRRAWSAAAAGEGQAAPVAGAPEEIQDSTLVTTEIRSLSVGVFHRSREPEGPPLAAEGDHVDAGQPVGVVETLGMASDVTSHSAGRLTLFAVENEQPVEFGTVVAIVEPD